MAAADEGASDETRAASTSSWLSDLVGDAGDDDDATLIGGMGALTSKVPACLRRQ